MCDKCHPIVEHGAKHLYNQKKNILVINIPPSSATLTGTF